MATKALVYVPASVLFHTFVPDAYSSDKHEVFFSEYCDSWTFGDIPYSLISGTEFGVVLFRYLRDNGVETTNVQYDRYWDIVGDAHVALNH